MGQSGADLGEALVGGIKIKFNLTKENPAYIFIGTAIGIMVQGFEWIQRRESYHGRGSCRTELDYGSSS
ncbi:unnamed protein product [Brassica oleracea]|uniref:Uncharacterized protein n=1 Tax=Brassica oleracea TaxID=3712 RepID=A0A3P6AN27_BRAOL|nr:unnamed protein product [Brassica oleracea]